MMEREEKTKCLIIGLDGATFRIIKPLMEKGGLPNIGEMMKNGVSAKLASVIPPLTASAWVSFMTGKNPGKHGIFDFDYRVDNTYDFSLLNSNFIDGDTLWAMLSRNDKKVVVINVPFTYPPERVNGFLISGILTPLKSTFTYPPSLKEELVKEFGDLRFVMKEDARLEDKEAWLSDLYNVTEKCAEIAFYIMENYDWDFFMVVFMGIDWIQHHFWKYMDPKNPRYDPEKSELYGDAILKFYQYIDTLVGKIVEKAGENTITFVMSDHGFGPVYKIINVNNWLMNLKLLRLKRERRRIEFWLSKIGLTKERFLNLIIQNSPRKLLKLLLRAKSRVKKVYDMELSFADVDWSQTKVYAHGHGGRIFVNLEGREPQGIVKPGNEFEELRNYLKEKLYELEDPECGCRVIEKVLMKEEVYWGAHLDRAPDIVFDTKTGYTVYNSFELGRNSTFVPAGDLRSGSHEIDGIFIAAGKGIKQMTSLSKLRIWDITPTVLHVMGVPFPTDLDGRVVKEIFDPRSDLGKREIKYCTYRMKESRRESAFSKRDEEEIKKRMKALGYF